MKKSVKIVIISLAAVLVVAGTSLAFFWDNVTNLIAKKTKSPEEYYAHVEKSNIEATASTIHSLLDFDSVSENYKKGNDASFKVEFGEGLSPFVKTVFGSEIDINWLKSVELSGETYNSSDKFDMTIIAKLNEKEIVSASLISDINNQIVYASVPLITNDKYVKIDYKELMGSSENSEDETFEDDFSDVQTSTISGMLDVFLGSNSEYIDISKIIPTEEVISALLSDYFEVIVNNIGKAEKTSEKLTIDGVTQSCTLISFIIDEKDFYTAIKAVLEKAKDDDRIEKIIKDFALEMKEDGEKFYEEFSKSVQESIDSLSKNIEDLSSKSEEELEKENIVFKTWVDNKGSVIARSFEVIDEEDKGSLFIGTVKDGSDIATQLTFCDETGKEVAKFLGKGTLKKGLLSGQYTLCIEEKEAVKFNVKDFDLKAFKENKLLGELGISVGKDFAGYFEDEVSAELLDLISKSEIKLTSSENTFSFEVLSDGKQCIKINASYKEKEYRESSIPADDKLIDLKNEEALEQVLADFNPQTFIDKFVEAGVPQDLIDSMTAQKESPELPDLDEDWEDISWDYDEDISFEFEYDENWEDVVSFEFDEENERVEVFPVVPDMKF